MRLITDDWYALLGLPWSYLALTVSAVICGTIIGVEREKKVKPAGLRTMILIVLGSTLFTMISAIAAGESGDKSRIAAQIVTGIGFLGAGAILHDTVRIRGLTTAAMIWFMAAVGMLCGAGFGGVAVMLTCVLTLILQFITHIEKRYLGPCYHTQVTLFYDDFGGKTGVKIDSILEEFRIKPGTKYPVDGETGLTGLTLNYCNAHKHHKAFLLKFAQMPEIKEIQRDGARDLKGVVPTSY